MGGFAWVTLATNDSYSLGALILAHSLKEVGTSHQLAVLVTPGVTTVMKEKLSTVFDLVEEVNILDSRDEANLRLLRRPELGVTFTKLHCWRLTQYEKCVFLDADTLVLQNCDELFEREELSAAPDVGWPDCFNSGVFVYRPSNETYEKLVQFALDKGSFDGGDQGLLNLYFSDWAYKDISKHLPFIYNMCSTACYSYLPAFKQFGGGAKIIHFIGPAKPWLQYFDSETRLVSPSGGMQHLQDVLQKWWNIFCEKIHPVLSRDMKSRDTTRSSSIVPPQINFIPINPEIHDFSTTNDYENVWNPWDEYEMGHTGDVLVDFQNQQLVIEHICNSLSPTINLCDSNVNVPPLLHQDLNQSFSEDISEDSSDSIASSIDSHTTSVSELDLTDYPENSNNSKLKVSFLASHEVYPITPINDINSPMLSDPYQLTPELPIIPVLPLQFESTTTVGKHTTLHTPDYEENDNAGLAGAFAQLTLGAPRTSEQIALENHLRRQGWEVGNIDYLGKDSFDNIWSKICETIGDSKPPSSTTSSTATPPAEKVSTATPSPEKVEAVAAKPKDPVSQIPSEESQQQTKEETVPVVAAPPPTASVPSARKVEEAKPTSETTSTPTPPPRKGSGGTKKVTKPKK